MSQHTQTRAKAAPAAKASAGHAGLLQRKCACGSTPGLTGECQDCGKKRLVGMQTKLAIGPPADHFEQEADRVAERVLSAPAPAMHGQAAPAVQRQAVTSVGHAPAGASFDAPPAVRATLDSPGRPLDAPTRTFMESRFGHDFGGVRVHTDARAAESARAVDALAYTVGSHVVFNEGRYAPGTQEGRRLLAHELTHVLQQTGGTAPRLQRQACGHDGKETGCGPNIGFLKFTNSILQLDDTVIKEGLQKDLGGKWLTQVMSPKNPEKAGEEGGRIDGVKVLSSEGVLSVEVVEVKPRSTGAALGGKPTGGCTLATKEATGYVSELKKIAPKVKTLSEKFSPFGGYRLMDHHAPKSKVERGIFEKAGVNIDDKEWFDAWKFYNSLQQKIPKVFTKAFTSVNVGLYTGGAKNKKYRAYGWLIQCKDKKPGMEELFYMLNQEGGVSYGCEKQCEPRKDDVREKEKDETKDVEEPKNKPTAPPVAVVPPVIDVFNLFRPVWVWHGLPKVPPGSLIIFGIAEKFFDTYVGHIKVTDTLQLLKLRLSAPLFTRLESSVILFTAAVTGVVAASVAIAAAPAAGAGAVAGAGAATTTATTTAAAATPEALVVGRFLATAAANDNAIAFAKAAGVLLAVGAASASKEANAEEGAAGLVKSVIEDNKAVLAVGNATNQRQLDQPGARFLAGNNKVYKVFAVARS